MLWQVVDGMRGPSENEIARAVNARYGEVVSLHAVQAIAEKRIAQKELMDR